MKVSVSKDANKDYDIKKKNSLLTSYDMFKSSASKMLEEDQLRRARYDKRLSDQQKQTYNDSQKQDKDMLDLEAYHDDQEEKYVFKDQVELAAALENDG